MPRQGGDVTWTDIDPCYVFHTINGVDGDDGTVALDVGRYPKMFDTDTDPYGIGGTPPRLERWTIDPAAGTVGQDRTRRQRRRTPTEHCPARGPPGQFAHP